MFELKVKSHFAGAHQLTMVGQKCENLHGHNWHIEVCVTGEKLNSAGVLADFGDIKKVVREVVEGDLDHKFLNELEIFEGMQPTSERIAVYIAKRVQTLLEHDLEKDVRVSKVMAWESDDTCATYFP
ncbi:MAG: 6-carboxytetrahydropterin synthase QueD [Desulfobacterales bacterium]|nr:6-carboxytetrahydropterin synthase QueD [Desulfobacterales bacterium]MBU8909815.1 6-carboxytetrahydropterin synthase QueD [Desulfobacterales bacterium]